MENSPSKLKVTALLSTVGEDVVRQELANNTYYAVITNRGLNFEKESYLAAQDIRIVQITDKNPFRYLILHCPEFIDFMLERGRLDLLDIDFFDDNNADIFGIIKTLYHTRPEDYKKYIELIWDNCSSIGYGKLSNAWKSSGIILLDGHFKQIFPRIDHDFSVSHFKRWPWPERPKENDKDDKDSEYVPPTCCGEYKKRGEYDSYSDFGDTDSDNNHDRAVYSYSSESGEF